MKKFLMLVFAAVLAVSAVCFAEAPKAAEGIQTVQTQTAAAYKTLTPQRQTRTPCIAGIGRHGLYKY